MVLYIVVVYLVNKKILYTVVFNIVNSLVYVAKYTRALTFENGVFLGFCFLKMFLL